MPYRVNEIFYSLQGEGHYTGTPAVFVRMSGCNRACPFCDTDFHDYTLMDADDIVAEFSRYRARHVVITGGEPTLQLDDTLVMALKNAGAYIQIETNGTLPVPPGVDWVTCSPKNAPWGIDRVDELKVVYLEPRDKTGITGQHSDPETLAAAFAPLGVKVYSLQPCSCLNVAETVEYIKSHPRWRLSLQTHKMIDIR